MNIISKRLKHALGEPDRSFAGSAMLAAIDEIETLERKREMSGVTIAGLQAEIAVLRAELRANGKAGLLAKIGLLEKDLAKARRDDFDYDALVVDLSAQLVEAQKEIERYSRGWVGRDEQINELIADRDEERRAKAWELFRRAMTRLDEHCWERAGQNAFGAVDAFFNAELDAPDKEGNHEPSD